MRVSYQGWSRDHGDKDILASRKLEKSDVVEDISSYERDKVYISKYRTVGGRDAVKISGFASIRCNGEYLVEVRLSPSDLDLLFSVANSEVPFGEVVKRLS